MATALTNSVLFNGQYNGEPFARQSELITTQIVGMMLVMTAIPTVWVDGELTYTVRLTNNDTVLPLTNLVLTDTLNPLLTTFVNGSVLINGVAPAAAADVVYDATSGLLTVRVPDLAVAEIMNITFRITQKQPLPVPPAPPVPPVQG